MKKWYQRCAWMLVATLALELSGCAKGSAYLSRMTGRDQDQKLVDVDGKVKKKGSSRKSDPIRDKATDSQLAKKSSKPKVQSSDDSKVASSKAPAKNAVAKAPPKTTSKSAKSADDPFMSDELEAFAAAKSKAKKVEADSVELAGKAIDDVTQSTSKAVQSAAADGRSQIREVAHKVEENLADLGDDIPEWARDRETTAKSEIAQVKATAQTKLDAASARVEKDFGEVNEYRQKISSKLTDPTPTRPAAVAAEAEVDLAGMCPDAQGELRELVNSLKESDTEGLKRGIHRIGRMGPDGKPAAPALVHLLKHKDGFVRTHSALALARMQASPPDAVQTVVDGLKSTDPGLRSFAALVLAEMGPQAGDALSTLAESLQDRDGYVRLHAAEVLIRYDQWSYQALDTLLHGLKDKDENIRWLATYSLAECAPESQETVDALLKATHDPVLKVKMGAVYALGEIGPFAKSASADLRSLADSTQSSEFRTAIVYALQQIEQ